MQNLQTPVRQTDFQQDSRMGMHRLQKYLLGILGLIAGLTVLLILA